MANSVGSFLLEEVCSIIVLSIDKGLTAVTKLSGTPPPMYNVP
jgi:hypothetical protein